MELSWCYPPPFPLGSEFSNLLPNLSLASNTQATRNQKIAFALIYNAQLLLNININVAYTYVCV